MPSLTLAALLSSGRFALDAAFVAGGLLAVMLLFLPDPTGSLAFVLVPLALAAGVVVLATRDPTAPTCHRGRRTELSDAGGPNRASGDGSILGPDPDEPPAET